MKRNKDFTSDAVRDSIQATMAKIEAYFNKKWAPGKEYDVIKHINALLDEELDKYLAPGEAGDAYRHLASYSREKGKKYDTIYAKNLEKYGPHLMLLLVEYADTIVLTGRYDVGDRYDQVSDDIMKKQMKHLFSVESIKPAIDAETAAIAKFMKEHGVEDYSITNGTVALAVDVNDDITLVKKDAPRGLFRHEFGKISGSFICRDCGLKSLQFGPKEVGGDFDCSNNHLSKYDLHNAPKVVGGNFIWQGNDDQVTYTEIKKNIKVGGRIYTDAPLTPEEKEDFKQQLIKEQNAFMEVYKAKGKVMDKAVQEKDIKTLEECREFFINAVDFFKERPWLKETGMKISYKVLLKIYAHLHQMAPEKYPDFGEEVCKVSKLTEKGKYPDSYSW